MLTVEQIDDVLCEFLDVAGEINHRGAARRIFEMLRLEELNLRQRLAEVAVQLERAPAHTEELAKAQLPSSRYPHQVGGLSQICTSSADDIEAIIRRRYRRAGAK